MITYLKKNSTIGTQYFLKLTEEKEIVLADDDLSFNDRSEEAIESTIGWYKENWHLTDATRQEFDDAYKKIVEKLNKTASE